MTIDDDTTQDDDPPAQPAKRSRGRPKGYSPPSKLPSIGDLSPKESEFLRRYIEQGCKNAAGAYKAAFKNPRMRSSVASNCARNILLTPTGRETVAEAKKAVVERTTQALELAGARYAVTKSNILERLAHLAFSDIRSYVDWDNDTVVVKPSIELTDAEAYAVVEVYAATDKNGDTQVRVKIADKKAALTDLAKVAGLLDKEIADSREDDAETKEARAKIRQQFLDALERMAQPTPLIISPAPDAPKTAENSAPRKRSLFES